MSKSNINRLHLHGELVSIRVSTPKDETRKPSAIITVRYGENRPSNNQMVQYTKHVEVRVPSFLYERNQDQLVAGKFIVLKGHLQGVLKQDAFTTELVADSIRIQDTFAGNFDTFIISGVLTAVQELPSRDPNKQPSASLIVRYGPERKATNNKVDFVNAVQIRVPAHRYEHVKGRLTVGMELPVEGNISGVIRNMGTDVMTYIELSADNIMLAKDSSAS